MTIENSKIVLLINSELFQRMWSFYHIITLMFDLTFSFLGYNHEATFTISRRGHLKLVHNEYEFTKVRFSKTTSTTAWRCALPHSFPQFQCDAKAFTKKFDSMQMLKMVGEHTHTPNKQNELRRRKKTKTVEIPPFVMMD